ncbi:MAG: hypothetical protein M1821_005791 [Bathelium mastoideum]|nr:MAG: hypothetical protein M1821_005791 [Bathelium mastoideum]
MDYLPLPAEARSAHVEIPFLAELQYDGNGFDDFLSRKGFTYEDVEQAEPKKLASLLQSWLFFGLLCVFTRRPLRIEDFRHHRSGAEIDVVNTRPLVAIFEDPVWIFHFKESVRWHNTLDSRHESCICHRLAWVSHFFDFFDSSEVDDIPFDEAAGLVLLSIRVLIRALVAMVDLKDAWNVGSEQAKLDMSHVFCPWNDYHLSPAPPLASLQRPPSPSCRTLIGMLEQAGLCPFSS